MPIIYPIWNEWNAVLNAKTYNYNLGGAYPIPETFDLIIANFDDDSLSQYSEFRLTCLAPASSVFIPPSAFAPFIDPVCYTSQPYPVDGATFIPLTNNTSFPFTPVFQNLETLDAGGEYLFLHRFRVDGKKVSDGTWENYVGEKEYYTWLYVTDNNYDFNPANLLETTYVEGSNAFTLEKIPVNINTVNENTYFQFNTQINTYGFVSDTDFPFLIEQKIVPFNLKANIYINDIIHRRMRRFEELSETTAQYKPATVSIICAEKDLVTDYVIRTATIANIPFIAGLKNEITTAGFLDFNPLSNRVTKKAFAYLNILIPGPGYEIKVHKNGEHLETIELGDPENRIICKKVFFNNYTQGDIIQFILLETEGETQSGPTKTFIMFPDGKYSNMIVWENEFLLKSAIECTGDFIFGGDLNFFSQETVHNEIEVINHLSSSKNAKLDINTGWLLFTDIDTVESLMRSRRAWLAQGNKYISLSSTAKKAPTKNPNEELISFWLEFTINKKYHEETYSF